MLSRYKDFPVVLDQIKGAIRNNRVAHGYIIESDLTFDKVTFAKDVFKALLCTNARGEGCDKCVTCRKIDDGNYEDLHIIEPEKDKKIKREDIENLRKKIITKPTGEGKRHLVIINRGDSMNTVSQNRLLKTLEEPASEGTVIMILSENTQYLLPTIRSRCVIFHINTWNLEESFGEDSRGKTFVEMIVKKDYFYKIVNFVEKEVKNTEDTKNLLDSMQKVLREYVISNRSSYMDRGKALEAVKLVEEAKLELAYNSNYKYVLKMLALKIGGAHGNNSRR